MSTEVCPRRLRRREASEYLKTRWGLNYLPTTLAKLACLGGGPAFEHFGRTPLYREDELDRWVQDRMSGLKRSTSDPGVTSSGNTVENSNLAIVE